LKILPTFYIRNGLAVPSMGSEAQGADPLDLASFVLDRGGFRATLIDVDAAHGTGHNREVLGRIMHRFRQGSGRTCLQVGGGIRSSDQAQYFLDQGAAWLMVGTLLHLPSLVMEQLLARFRTHLTASIDAQGGELHRSGWSEPAGAGPEGAFERILAFGFPRVLFMDIPATGSEPDFGTARALALACHVPLFMGGSLRTREHLRLASELPGLQGVLMDVLDLKADPGLMDPLPPTGA
jgi:phosphoribosylformimino-5-aminoimidazole carboxamide ribonucleotide (ProFAR) isomerase